MHSDTPSTKLPAEGFARLLDMAGRTDDAATLRARQPAQVAPEGEREAVARMRAYLDGPLRNHATVSLSREDAEFLLNLAALRAPAPAARGGVTGEMREAAAFLLWQYDRKGPVLDCDEAWGQLRAALAADKADGSGEADRG